MTQPSEHSIKEILWVVETVEIDQLRRFYFYKKENRHNLTNDDKKSDKIIDRCGDSLISQLFNRVIDIGRIYLKNYRQRIINDR